MILLVNGKRGGRGRGVDGAEHTRSYPARAASALLRSKFPPDMGHSSCTLLPYISEKRERERARSERLVYLSQAFNAFVLFPVRFAYALVRNQ